MKKNTDEEKKGKIVSVLERLWLWKIGEAETGVAVTLGYIGRVLKSGLRLGPLPIIGKVVRFPTTQFELRFEITQAVTQRSYYYPGMREIAVLEARIEKIIEEIRKEKNSVILEEKERQLREASAKLKEAEEKLEEAKKEKTKEGREERTEFDESVEIPKIGCTIYLRYSADDDLRETLRVLGGPKNQEQLKGHYEGVVVGCFRDIVGTIPWRAVIENRDYIIKEMQKRFIEPESPFMIAGFKSENIYVAMTVVDLPDALTALLNLPQQEELKALAAKKVAQRLKAEIGEGIGEAAKALEEQYSFPRNRAQDAAVERHGDILAAREGELKRIQWMTKDGCVTGGGGIKPEMIAQAVVVAQEMLAKKQKSMGGGAAAGAKESPAESERKPKTFAELVEETRKQRKG